MEAVEPRTRWSLEPAEMVQYVSAKSRVYACRVAGGDWHHRSAHQHLVARAQPCTPTSKSDQLFFAVAPDRGCVGGLRFRRQRHASVGSYLSNNANAQQSGIVLELAILAL